MTTYYDSKAARRAAAGEAAKARAEAEAMRADADARREQARAERQRADRDHTAQRRRETLARAAGWAKNNVLHLVFVPVIVVPALLAWSAIAAYGTEIYGPLGVLLPAFSEGAMWAFAAATTISAHRDPHRPTGMLTAGTAVFALIAAVLNFLHGLAMDHVGGVVTGIVMALVSVGGVIAHQLVTAGPVRSRVQRDEARLARQEQRRITALRRAALRTAPAEIGPDGSVRLLHRPRTLTLRRDWTGRLRRLVETAVPGLPVPAAADDFDTELAALLNEASEPAGTAQTPTLRPVVGTTGTDPELTAHLAAVREAIARGELVPEPSRREIQRYLSVRASTAQAVRRALDDGGEGVAA